MERKEIELNFSSELNVNGLGVKLGDFDRYSNPFTEMEWGARNISIKVMIENKCINIIFERFPSWKDMNQSFVYTGWWTFP